MRAVCQVHRIDSKPQELELRGLVEWRIFRGTVGLEGWKEAGIWKELRWEPIATSWIMYHCLGTAVGTWPEPSLLRGVGFTFTGALLQAPSWWQWLEKHPLFPSSQRSASYRKNRAEGQLARKRYSLHSSVAVSRSWDWRNRFDRKTTT